MHRSLRRHLARKTQQRKLFDAFTHIAGCAFAGIFIVLTLQIAFPQGMTALVDDLVQKPQLAQRAIAQEFNNAEKIPLSTRVKAYRPVKSVPTDRVDV